MMVGSFSTRWVGMKGMTRASLGSSRIVGTRLQTPPKATGSGSFLKTDPNRQRIGVSAFPVSVRRGFGQPALVERFPAAQSALRDGSPGRTGPRGFLSQVQPRRAGLGRPRPAAVLRRWTTASNGIPDRLHRRPCALLGLALLAPVRSVSGRRRGRLAGTERLPRVVSGRLGLALLEIVSRKAIR